MISSETSAHFEIYKLLKGESSNQYKINGVYYGDLHKDSLKHYKNFLADQLCLKLKYILTNTSTLFEKGKNIYLESISVDSNEKDMRRLRIDLDKFVSYEDITGAPFSAKYNECIDNEFYTILSEKMYETFDKTGGYIQNILYDSEHKIKIIPSESVFDIKPSFYYNRNKIYISAIIELL
jgi:hypothetical protein